MFKKDKRDLKHIGYLDEAEGLPNCPIQWGVCYVMQIPSMEEITRLMGNVILSCLWQGIIHWRRTRPEQEYSQHIMQKRCFLGSWPSARDHIAEEKGRKRSSFGQERFITQPQVSAQAV